MQKIMGFPPQAFIIGAMKSGTTSLADWLAQHPSITVSEPKEAAYFTRNWKRGPSWYETRFCGPAESVFLDATPAYSNSPTETYPDKRNPKTRFSGVPGRIHSVAPNARFIYILRDPASRTYSHYWHHVRKREENRNFHDAIRNDTRYLRASDYYGQLVNYMEYFPLSSFLILKFEEMIKDPIDSVERCCEFLGVSYTEIGKNIEITQKNRSYQYNAIGRLVTGLFPSDQALKEVFSVAKSVVPEWLKPIAANSITKGLPPIAPEERLYLTDCFRDSTEKLSHLTGLSFDGWQV